MSGTAVHRSRQGCMTVMNWLVSSGLKFGRMAVALVIALPLLALAGWRSAPVDVYPEFMPATVEIQTEALGLSAAEVEHFITLGMEQDLLNGVPWLTSIHSRSMPGLSVIDLLFEPGTDVYAARQMVTERMTQARVLPNVGSAPVMIEPLASTSRIAMIGLSAKDTSLVQLSQLARWKLKPRLMGVPGVANVAIYGQRDRQLQVTVDPAKLHAQNVTLTQVIETAGNSLWVSPLTFVEASTPGTGGFVEGASQRLAIQHISPISTPQQLAAVPVQDKPALRLGDVADVIEDHQPLIGDALVDGVPSLFLVIEKYPGMNTLEVTRNLEAALADMAPGLTGVTVTTDVYRPATYIETALRNVGLVALLGLLLLLVVLLAVLSSWRVALIGAITVPLTLLTAAYVLYLGGATFTTMTMMGLAVAVGFVVDDAVRDANGLSRRLRELPEDTGPLERAATAVRACVDERGSAVFATLIVLLATAPLLVLDSVTTAFTAPMVATYALALAASMFVALMLTPPLAVLIRGRGQPENSRPLARWVRRTFDGSVRRWLARPVVAWAGVGVLVLAAVAAVPQLGAGTQLPSLADRNLLLQVDTAPGTSLAEMDRIAGRLSQELRAQRGVLDVGVHVGRAMSSDQMVDTNSAELWINLAESADYDATKALITTVARGYPGVSSRLLTYADGQLAGAAGSSDDVVVRVYGIELDELRTLGEKVRRVVADVPGLVSPTLRPVVQQPTVQIDVDVDKAQKYGLKPGDIRRDATTLTSGLIVGNLYEQAKIFDVVVWGSPQTRNNVTELQNLLLDTPAGGQVRLADVASVTVKPQPTQITHDEVLRDAEIVASISGRDPNAVVADVKARIATVAMPYEYHAEVLGTATTRQDRTRVVWAFAAAALVAVLLQLQAASGSWRRSLVLVVLLPLSAAGGALTAPLAGGLGSAGALAGVFAAVTLAVRGGVVLLRRIKDLEGTNGWAHDPAVVLEATRDQAVPVIQTVLATAALLLPAAALGNRAGLELLHPLAVTLLGALVSLLLTMLVVLPAALILVSPRGRSHEHSVDPSTLPIPA
jgi:Cu/Ag efflux pump CusA